MTPAGRAELRRYVKSRKPKWTPADKIDAVVALACAIFFVWLVL